VSVAFKVNYTLTGWSAYDRRGYVENAGLNGRDVLWRSACLVPRLN